MTETADDIMVLAARSGLVRLSLNDWLELRPDQRARLAELGEQAQIGRTVAALAACLQAILAPAPAHGMTREQRIAAMDRRLEEALSHG